MDPMPRARPTQRLTGRTLLYLEFLGIFLGACTFAIDPLNFIHPGFAIAGVVGLVAFTLVIRVIPSLRLRTRLTHSLEIAALLVYAALMTTSTGASSSPFLSLYALPVIAGALLWRPWKVLAFAAVVFTLALIQSGLFDAMNDMYFLTTAAVLLNVLAPSLAAAVILAGLQGKIGDAELKVTELAERDGMTGLLNLQAFDVLLNRHHGEAERMGQQYSLAIIDVDDLRQMNEALGHDAGSQMIASVAQAITRSIRASDHAARMGGDVFVVLLSDADQPTAAGIAQRIRNNVYNATLLVENRMVRATVSIGVATFPRDEQHPKSLMILADQRMEQDKTLRRPPAR